MRLTWLAPLVGLLALMSSSGTEAAETGRLAPTLVKGAGELRGGRFVAGLAGAEWQLPGGGTVRLAPGTIATVMPQPQVLAFPGGRRVPTYSVILTQGRVDTLLADSTRPASAVVIGAPRDVRMLTSSGCTVVVATTGKTRIASLSGSAQVGQKSRLSSLRSGYVRSFERDSVVDSPLLSSPQWATGAGVLLALGGPTALHQLTWAPVPGAARYALRVFDQTGHVVAQVEQPETQLKRAVGPLSPGHYSLELGSLDADGVPSQTSLKQPLTVLGLELPGGASVGRDDRVALGTEQRVKLVPGDGLELTLSGLPGKHSADLPFGLVSGQPTRVALTQRGGGASASFWLVPRPSLVSVWVGPKYVYWPGELVQLEVQMKDASGRPLPAGVEVTPKVLLGLTPLPVEWTRDAATWRAAVPAPEKGRGPWVVRVEVEDQWGVLLGRDFVEVSPIPQSGQKAQKPASIDLDQFPHPTGL